MNSDIWNYVPHPSLLTPLAVERSSEVCLLPQYFSVLPGLSDLRQQFALQEKEYYCGTHRSSPAGLIEIWKYLLLW